MFTFFTLLCVYIFPGTGAVRFLGLWERSSWTIRLILSLCLSQFLMPALLYSAGHWWTLTWELASVIGVSSGLLLFFAKPKNLPTGQLADRSPALLGLFILVGLGALIQLIEFTDPITFTEVSDWQKHLGMLLAVAEQSLPPANPFFRPGEDVQLSYYYLFYLGPAVLGDAAGAQSATLFSLPCAITGISLLGAIYLWIRKFSATRAALWSVAILCLVGGLDILWILRSLTTLCSGQGLTCWTTNAVAAWHWRPFLQDIVWAPHHVIVTAGLFFFPFLVQHLPNRSRLYALTPFFTLSMVGSSAYVSILGLATLILFFSIKTIRDGRKWFWSLVTRDAIFGFLVTAAFITVFAIEIWPHPDSETAGLVLGSFSTAPPFQHLKTPWYQDLGRAALYLLLLFGPYLFPILFAGPKRIWSKLSLWNRLLFCVCMFIAVCIESTGFWNDLSYRAFFISRCIFAIAAAYALLTLLERKQPLKILGALALLLVGSLTTVHAIYAFGPIRMVNHTKLSKSSLDFIEAGQYVRSNTKKEEIVQGPYRWTNLLMKFTHRKSAILEGQYGSIYNVDHPLFQHTATTLNYSFDNLDQALSWKIFRSLDVDYIFCRRKYCEKASPAFFEGFYENENYMVLKVRTRRISP